VHEFTSESRVLIHEKGNGADSDGRDLGAILFGTLRQVCTVRIPPEGHCGFEPLNLPQATGSAGYGDVAITGIMRTW